MKRERMVTYIEHYALGMLPPNYPVPAIHLCVDITDIDVSILALGKGWDNTGADYRRVRYWYISQDEHQEYMDAQARAERTYCD